MPVKRRRKLSLLGLVIISFLALGCDEIEETAGEQVEAPADTSVTDSAADTSAAVAGDAMDIDPTLFLEAGLASDITQEPCTLSGGTETTCYRFTVASIPVDHEAGPWCPETIADSAEAGGIWPEDGQMNDVDGAFVENLDTFYSDDGWKLYEEDGSIRVTGSAAACAAAARPDVDEAYNNYCVQCLLAYVEDDLTTTYVVPISAVEQETPSQLGRGAIGVAFNGVNFDPPAPTEAILGAYTLAPFDDCGGHVNLNEGYHYHAHTGCTTEVAQGDGHAPLIGYMLDGYGLYARTDEQGNEATGLDQCGGQYDEVRGYHYHVGTPGSNAIVGCFKGETGCRFDGDGEGELCDATAATDRPGRPEGGPEGRPEGRPEGPPPGGANGRPPGPPPEG
ncbi:MAG: YHYH protein [Phormidesmis sp.]